MTVDFQSKIILCESIERTGKCDLIGCRFFHPIKECNKGLDCLFKHKCSFWHPSQIRNIWYLENLNNDINKKLQQCEEINKDKDYEIANLKTSLDDKNNIVQNADLRIFSLYQDNQKMYAENNTLRINNNNIMESNSQLNMDSVRNRIKINTLEKNNEKLQCEVDSLLTRINQLKKEKNDVHEINKTLPKNINKKRNSRDINDNRSSTRKSQRILNQDLNHST